MEVNAYAGKRYLKVLSNVLKQSLHSQRSAPIASVSQAVRPHEFIIGHSESLPHACANSTTGIRLTSLKYGDMLDFEKVSLKGKGSKDKEGNFSRCSSIANTSVSAP